MSLTSGCIHKDWSRVLISPVYKKGNVHEASNYRPVSLTSVACKILEHIVCKHLLDHLERHNLLTTLQHCFRKAHSCESQLLITHGRPICDLWQEDPDGCRHPGLQPSAWHRPARMPSWKASSLWYPRSHKQLDSCLPYRAQYECRRGWRKFWADARSLRSSTRNGPGTTAFPNLY